MQITHRSQHYTMHSYPYLFVVAFTWDGLSPLQWCLPHLMSKPSTVGSRVNGMIQPFTVPATDIKNTRTRHDLHNCFDCCKPSLKLTTLTLFPTSGCIGHHQLTDERIPQLAQHVTKPSESPSQQFLSGQRCCI